MRIIVTLYGTTAGAADVPYFTHQSGEGKTLDHQATVVQEILSRAGVEGLRAGTSPSGRVTLKAPRIRLDRFTVDRLREYVLEALSQI